MRVVAGLRLRHKYRDKLEAIQSGQERLGVVLSRAQVSRTIVDQKSVMSRSAKSSNTMKYRNVALLAPILTLLLLCANAPAQTEGTAKLQATILDYTGTSSARHWTVAWVTTGAGAFIKTVWIQGNNNNYWASHWNSHCAQWYAARAGSQALDGYSSATAQTYASPNNPVNPTWNCRDAANNLMPDGNYKFWIQYAEDSGQGPYTTSGLTWTKGPIAATNTYPNQGANFASMSVAWNPVVVPTVPPEFTMVELIGGNLVMSGTGPTNGACAVLISSQPDLPVNQWSAISTNACDANGQFRITNSVSIGISSRFYRLKVQ